MNKKVSFGAKPQASINPDEWVNGATSVAVPSSPPPDVERVTMKRLTFDVSADLHTRIKVQCAVKGVKLADEIRLLLEEHFPATTKD